MPASEETVIEIRGLDRLLRRFNHMERYFFSQELMSELAQYIITAIQLRTAEGIDAEGSEFIPYSPLYALFRESQGHPTDKVSLFFSGTMLSSMTFDATKDTARIFFMRTTSPPIRYRTKSGRTVTRQSKVTSAQKAYFLNQDRRFFAISESEQQKIMEIVRNYLDNLIFQAT